MLKRLFQRGRPTFVSYLVAFGLALATPLVVYAAAVTFQLAAQERGAVVADVGRKAKAIVAATDRMVASRIAALRILASARAVRDSDLSEFYAEALSASRDLGGSIALVEPDGRRLVYSRVPWGALLARDPAPELVARAARTAEPQISGLVVSPQTGERLVAIAVPVMTGRGTGRVLVAEIPLDEVLATIVAAGIAAPHWGSVSDGAGLILARSEEGERVAGRSLPEFAEIAAPFGTWAGVSPDGLPVFGAFERSTLTGWTAAVGLPRAALDVPLVRSRVQLAGLALVLVVLAFVLSVPICREIARACNGLAVMARELGDGSPVRARDLPIAEASAVAAAMVRASLDLDERGKRLAQAKEDLELRVAQRTRELEEKSVLLQATLDNMAQGLLVVDETGRVSVHNRRALELLDLPPELMRSKPTVAEVHAYQLSIGDFIKPEDSRRVEQLQDGGGIEGSIYERERPNGVVLEVRTVARPAGGAVRTFTDITQRKRAERELARMVRHDPLTGLPNRVLLRERLQAMLARAARGGERFSLLFLDLDRFKQVNDTLGHPAGDALLQAVAARIRGVLREEDMVARMGGDEFAVLQCGGDDPRAAQALSDRIVRALEEPVEIAGRWITTGASLGVACAPRDGDSPDALLQAADLALYRAKAEGRGRYRFFEPAMDAQVQERQALELELREAVARGELALRFQPIVSVESREIVACEALVRWDHPRLGLLGPDRFVPLAEETGLIREIGAAVLETACREAAAWPAAVPVAVNVSAVQFARGDLLDTVLGALEDSGLPPERLELEITETTLIEDGDAVLRTLHALRRRGVRFALDDFGTGYSSLAYLRRFPFHKLKIDGSFVREIERPETAGIVRAIVDLATLHGMAITAEGVETPEQLRRVTAEGCTQAQGYLFARPVTAGEIAALMRGARAFAA